MSTEKTLQTLSIKSESAEKTEKIGELIGQKLRGGEVIVLNSDLGGGKTTFVRGVMRGIGSKDKVTSPSFKISNTYKAKNFIINHFDFYRLQDPGLLVYELSDSFDDKNIITIIEWSEIVKHILPSGYFQVTLKLNNQDQRIIDFTFSSNSLNLLDNLYKNDNITNIE